MAESTVNQIVRAWWRGISESDGSVDLKAFAPQGAVALRGNPEFCALYLDHTLEQFVYETGQRMFAADRRMVRMGTEYMNASDLRAQIEDEAKRCVSFADWREYDPTSGSYVRLPSMDKSQVLAAADYRKQQANANAFEEAFLRLAAGRMDDGQQIQDVWSDEELRQLRAKIVVSMSFGMKGTERAMTREAAD